DVLDHAEGLLELAHGRLELTVEHFPVAHDDDRVEDAPVLRVVERRKAVGEPGNRERLSAAGGVLHEVALPRAVLARVRNQTADGVELLVTREHEEALAGLPSAHVLLLDLVNELAHEIQHAVPRPRVLPEIRRRVTLPRRRHRRVARTTEL